MSFAVYIAGCSSESSKARVAAAIASLQASGIIVTCSWPQVVAAVGAGNPRDATYDDRRGWATSCLAEIDSADAVWFLVPESWEVTRGAWLEAGYAFANAKHLVFSGDTKQSVFGALGTELESDTAALAFLRELSARKSELATAELDFDLSDVEVAP